MRPSLNPNHEKYLIYIKTVTKHPESCNKKELTTTNKEKNYQNYPNENIVYSCIEMSTDATVFMNALEYIWFPI